MGQNSQYNLQRVKVYLGSQFPRFQPVFVLFYYFWVIERQTIPVGRGMCCRGTAAHFMAA